MYFTDMLYEGKEIVTLTGYIVVGKQNPGGHVWCTEVECDEDGCSAYEEEHLLTLHDIAKRMKEVDGKNHKVGYVWYGEEDD